MELTLDELLELADKQKVWFKAATDWNCPVDDNEDLESLDNVITVVGNVFLEVYRYRGAFEYDMSHRDVYITEIAAWTPQGINVSEGDSGRYRRQKMILGRYSYDPKDEKTDPRINELCECFEDPRFREDYDIEIVKKKPHLGSRRTEIIGTLSPNDFGPEMERRKRKAVHETRTILNVLKD